MPLAVSNRMPSHRNQDDRIAAGGHGQSLRQHQGNPLNVLREAGLGDVPRKKTSELVGHSADDAHGFRGEFGCAVITVDRVARPA